MHDYKAVQITRPGRLELVSKKLEALTPGSARLRMEAIGICASDVAVLNGSHPFATYPVISGHEMAGVIEEVRGPGPFQVGQRVAVEPMVACGLCPSCRQGQPNRCDRVEVMGIQQPGGMAQRMVVDQKQLHPVPAELEAEAAAFIEPTAVAVHVCNRSGMKAGDRIAVVGTGKIGLLVLAVARARGAEAMLGVDIVPGRLRYAKLMGADWTALTPDDPVEAIGHEAAPAGFDVVIDTAGESASFALATKLARPGGVVVPVALPPVDMPVDWRDFYRKELSLRASRMYTFEFAPAAELLATGAVPAQSLVTHRMPLSQAAAAFELAANQPEEAVKVIIQAQPAQTMNLGRPSSREIIHE